MPTFDHLRWHLALALGGALVIERLHGPFATGLLALVALDRIATAAVPYVQRWRERSPVVMANAPDAGRTAARRPEISSGPATRRLPIALTRALNADCTTCRGFGCRTCAYTGLG